MLEEYDIDKLNPRPNPYVKELKKQVTIKIAPSVIDYFKGESQETGSLSSGSVQNSQLRRKKKCSVGGSHERKDHI
jgi:hypothetical protein